MKIKKLLVLVFLSVGLLVFPKVAFAECTELSSPFSGKTCVESFGDYVKTIIEWALTVIGPLALLMLIVGGWQYMMAAGNPDALRAAQRTITRALTGLLALIAVWGLLEILWPG